MRFWRGVRYLNRLLGDCRLELENKRNGLSGRAKRRRGTMKERMNRREEEEEEEEESRTIFVMMIPWRIKVVERWTPFCT